MAEVKTEVKTELKTATGADEASVDSAPEPDAVVGEPLFPVWDIWYILEFCITISVPA